MFLTFQFDYPIKTCPRYLWYRFPAYPLSKTLSPQSFNICVLFVDFRGFINTNHYIVIVVIMIVTRVNVEFVYVICGLDA